MAKSKDILREKSKTSEPLANAAGLLTQTEEEIETVAKVEYRDGKKVFVFSDPLYSREKRSIINYTIFRGRWEFELLDDINENEPEKCAVKFIPVRDSSNATIVFKSIKDKIEFMNSIYSDNDMRQLGGGMSLEKLANSKVLRTTGGIIGLSVAAYGLYKLFTRSKDSA